MNSVTRFLNFASGSLPDVQIGLYKACDCCGAGRASCKGEGFNLFWFYMTCLFALPHLALIFFSLPGTVQLPNQNPKSKIPYISWDPTGPHHCSKDNSIMGCTLTAGWLLSFSLAWGSFYFPHSKPLPCLGFAGDSFPLLKLNKYGTCLVYL